MFTDVCSVHGLHTSLESHEVIAVVLCIQLSLELEPTPMVTSGVKLLLSGV